MGHKSGVILAQTDDPKIFGAKIFSSNLFSMIFILFLEQLIHLIAHLLH